MLTHTYTPGEHAAVWGESDTLVTVGNFRWFAFFFVFDLNLIVDLNKRGSQVLLKKIK